MRFFVITLRIILYFRAPRQKCRANAPEARRKRRAAAQEPRQKRRARRRALP
jgi:hypothetical protein